MTTRRRPRTSRRLGKAAAHTAVALLTILVSGCDGDEPRPRTSAGLAAYPIVYASADGEAFHLWLMKEDGGDPRQLTHRPGTQEDPSWSPDGRRIAFAESGDRTDDYDIFVMNADGTGVRQFTDTDDQDEAMPSWSPDGTRLLYTAGSADSDVGRLVVIELADPGSPRVVSAHAWGWGSWSPDGREVLYTGPDEKRKDLRLWIAEPDGSGARSLDIRGVTSAYEASWSPDGTEIAFVAPSGPWDDDDPAKMNEDIWVTRVDGTRARKVVSTPGNDHWPPAWSPDGHQLLYTADGRSADADEGEIVAVDLATGAITKLTSNDVYDMSPDWRSSG